MSFIRSRLEHLIVVNGICPCLESVMFAKKSLKPSRQQLFPLLLDATFSAPLILTSVEADHWLVMPSLFIPHPKSYWSNSFFTVSNGYSFSSENNVNQEESLFWTTIQAVDELYVLKDKFHNSGRLILIFLLIKIFFICLKLFHFIKTRVHWDPSIWWMY